MGINKDCKEFITRPLEDYINRTALFIPVRAEAMKNLESEIKCDKPVNIFSTSIRSLTKMFKTRLKT